MTTGDAAFATTAAVALSAALVASLAASARRATIALLVVAVAEAALVASLGAWIVAALVAAVPVAGVVVSRRRPGGAGGASLPSSSVLPGIAFVALVARAVLMVGWPNALPEASSIRANGALAGDTIGLVHHLLVQFALLAFGWHAAIVRRADGNAAIGTATMLVAAVAAIAAAGHFAGGDAEVQARTLAIVVVTAAGAAIVGVAAEPSFRDDLAAAFRDDVAAATDPPASADAAESGNDASAEAAAALPPSYDDSTGASAGLLAALAGCALALLMGVW